MANPENPYRVFTEPHSLDRWQRLEENRELRLEKGFERMEKAFEERDRVTDERICKLVVAIGKLIAKMDQERGR